MVRAIAALAFSVFVGLAGALAQGAPPFVASAVDLEIAPAELEKFLAALSENASATIKEPGNRRYDVMRSATNPHQIFIYEVYADQAAVEAHRAADHFKKYQAVTKDMVVKRQSRPMIGIETHSK